MTYVTKQFTKFQTVGTAIKLSETFVSLKKLTAQNITKRYIRHSKYKRKHWLTNLKKIVIVIAGFDNSFSKSVIFAVWTA